MDDSADPDIPKPESSHNTSLSAPVRYKKAFYYTQGSITLDNNQLTVFRKDKSSLYQYPITAITKVTNPNRSQLAINTNDGQQHLLLFSLNAATQPISETSGRAGGVLGMQSTSEEAGQASLKPWLDFFEKRGVLANRYQERQQRNVSPKVAIVVIVVVVIVAAVIAVIILSKSKDQNLSQNVFGPNGAPK